MRGKVLTVSIAAYNVEKYIYQCLVPFTKQEVRDRVEVLVIDDGGKDGTVDITETFTKEYPNTFAFIHKENGGWGSTINKGLEIATGKYFKHLDGDDFLNGEYLPRYLDILENTDVDFVYNPFLMIEDCSSVQSGMSDSIDERIIGKKMNFIDAVNKMPRIKMHSSTFKTDLLRKNKIKVIENSFYADADYFIKGLVFVESLIVEDFPVYCYRVGQEGQSVSLTGLSKHYKDHDKVIDGLINYVNEADLSKEKKTILRSYICDSIAFYYEAMVRLKRIEELKEYDKKVFNVYHFTKEEIGNRSMLKYRQFDFKYAYLQYMVKRFIRDNVFTKRLYKFFSRRNYTF